MAKQVQYRKVGPTAENWQLAGDQVTPSVINLDFIEVPEVTYEFRVFDTESKLYSKVKRVTGITQAVKDSLQIPLSDYTVQELEAGLTPEQIEGLQTGINQPVELQLSGAGTLTVTADVAKTYDRAEPDTATFKINDVDTPLPFTLNVDDVLTVSEAVSLFEVIPSDIIIKEPTDIPFNTHSLVIDQKQEGVNITDNTLYPRLAGGGDKPFSVEMVVKPLASRVMVLPVMNNMAGFFNATGQFQFNINDGAGNRIALKSHVDGILVNDWVHIIFSYDGSELQSGVNLYINSLVDNSHDMSQGVYGGLPALVSDFVIQLPDTSDTVNFFEGKINLFRFYDKELSQSEVTQLYNARELTKLDGLAFEGNCKLEHRFNNSLISDIGSDAVAVGTLVYDTDRIWAVPENTIDLAFLAGLPSVWWARIYKSSDWPEIPTTKNYFTIYSTDHNSANNAIAWAECDDPFYNGFTLRGVIKSEFQSETPWLIRVPTADSGLVDETLFLYYHTMTDEPGNNGVQQTRLITTTGGALHTATWTDRGRPLGLEPGETHLGYAHIYKNDLGKYIANHVTHGLPDSKTAISQSTDGLTFTRVQDTTGLMVGGNPYAVNHIFPFKYNTVQYGFVILNINGGTKLALVTLDSNSLATSVVDIVDEFYTMQILHGYVEGTTAYLVIKPFSNSLYRNKDHYVLTYDLSQLP